MKTYAPQVLRTIFGYAGRGLLLAALATTLAVTGCGDEDDDLVTTDAAADTLGGDTLGGGDVLKPADSGTDAKIDALNGDAKPADAGGDAAVDAAAQ
ncbi:MAG: hypothetical protein SF187_07155 [Deltaproteobacteria bacterium]|nr:hypothetical protein [Deltaproteobacteria bacterium]